jgi:hypothetical protein
MMQSVGIEPTLLRTRALSVRLNRSAKTALLTTRHRERLHGAMATRRIPDPKIGGSIPSEVIQFFWCLYINQKEVLPGLEPGLQGSEPWVLTNYTIEPRPLSGTKTSSGGVVGYHACLTRTRSRVRSSSRVLFFCLT